MACRDIRYAPNGRHTCVGAPLFTLSFCYDFSHARDTVAFACHTPYSFSMLRSFLGRLCAHPATRDHVAQHTLCQSQTGARVPLLLITDGLPSVRTSASAHGVAGDRLLSRVRQKPGVVIIARQHPGEAVSSWVVSGLIRFLAGPSPEAVALREHFCFHVVPMVNVDGVILGSSRCTPTGSDPNRCWRDPRPDAHPVVFALRSHLAKVQQKSGVRLFLDVHGHAQRTAAFFYGCCPEKVQSALFPKLVSLATRDVDFEGSRWRFGAAHDTTARNVAFSELGVVNSFTLETSFFARRVPRSASEGPLAAAVRRA